MNRESHFFCRWGCLNWAVLARHQRLSATRIHHFSQPSGDHSSQNLHHFNRTRDHRPSSFARDADDRRWGSVRRCLHQRGTEWVLCSATGEYLWHGSRVPARQRTAASVRADDYSKRRRPCRNECSRCTDVVEHCWKIKLSVSRSALRALRNCSGGNGKWHCENYFTQTNGFGGLVGGRWQCEWLVQNCMVVWLVGYWMVGNSVDDLLVNHWKIGSQIKWMSNRFSNKR